MNTSDTWNAAAARAINMIFNIFTFEYSEDSAAGLRKMRQNYDVVFFNYFQKDAAVAGAGLSFINLGALALAAAAREFSDFYTEEEITAVVCQKQADYGSDNIARFGRDGILVRLHDKIARLENLTAKAAVPNNESIKDNYLDVIGYCTVGSLWESGEFLLPLTVAESNEITPLPQG